MMVDRGVKGQVEGQVWTGGSGVGKGTSGTGVPPDGVMWVGGVTMPST